MIYRMQLADSVDEMTFDLLEVPIEDKDIEGTADNTTIDGNVFTDYLWLKKQFVQKWSLMCEDDYTQLRGFYTRQWENAEVPTYKLFVGENRSETFTASGSSFQIQNGTQYDAPLTLTEIDGNAEQTTYSGKNLYTTGGATTVGAQTTIIDANSYSATTTGNWQGRLVVRISAPANTQLHFHWACSGTSAGQSILDKITGVQTGTTYIQSIYYNYYTGHQNSTTFTTTTDTELEISLYASGNYSTAGTYKMYDLQLEKGSSFSSFEPYVGGTPAPNPSFPMPISTTTGENVVKITGKNLFDKNNYFSTAGYFYSSDTIIGTGSATHNILFWIPCRPSTQYSLTIPTGYGIITKVATSEVVPANGVAVLGSQRYETTTINGYTTGATAKYLVAYLQAPNYTISDILSNITANLMVELGSTATTYEPYQGQEHEVNLGKNLLNTNAREWTLPHSETSRGITFTVNTDGSVSINGQNDGTGNSAFYLYNSSHKLSLKSGQYTGSLNANDEQITALTITIYDGSSYKNLTNQTQTLSGECLVYLQIPNGNTTNFSNYKIHPQLEAGSTATTYAPYFTPIELAKIGTYQDRIYKNDGKWYIYKEIGKVDLSTLTWTGGTANQGWIWTTTGFSNVKYVSANTQIGAILATNFTPHTASGMYNTHGNIAIDVSNVKATDNTGTSPTGQAYYALATATTTEITDSTLLAQLNFIANLYGGTNNITFVGTGAQGEIGVQYTLTYEKEQVIIPETSVRLNLTDGGVINPCGCRQNVQLTMRETIQ